MLQNKKIKSYVAANNNVGIPFGSDISVKIRVKNNLNTFEIIL